VTGIAGKPVREGTELQQVVTGLPLGQPVEVSVIRSGEARLAKIVIEEQPEDYGYATRDRDE
jgi:hypothetical protein